MNSLTKDELIEIGTLVCDAAIAERQAIAAAEKAGRDSEARSHRSRCAKLLSALAKISPELRPTPVLSLHGAAR